MIRRARPKYLTLSDFNNENNLSIIDENQNELFFNYGRSALKFFLINYAKYIKKNNLLVAMQSFNCNVVIEAVLQSNCKVILMDIQLDDFSINLEDIKKIKKPDILILTHYQGIPNLQYEQISIYCKKNGIFLIDDLAQTDKSSIRNIKVGDLSDVSFKSFAFDKPYSCLTGGSLNIANITDENLKNDLLNNYRELKIESKNKTLIDLWMLKFLYYYSDQEEYRPLLDNSDLIFFLKKLGFSDESIYNLVQNKYICILQYLISTIIRELGFQKNNIYISRLRQEKINLINKQRHRFSYFNKEVVALEDYLSKEGFRILDYPRDVIINWNRYSLIDKSGKLKSKLLKDGIQAGNYNWPNPLHKMYYNNRNVFFVDNFTNTDFASQFIVNIPLWSNIFRSISAH